MVIVAILTLLGSALALMALLGYLFAILGKPEERDPYQGLVEKRQGWK